MGKKASQERWYGGHFVSTDYHPKTVVKSEKVPILTKFITLYGKCKNHQNHKGAYCDQC